MSEQMRDAKDKNFRSAEILMRLINRLEPRVNSSIRACGN